MGQFKINNALLCIATVLIVIQLAEVHGKPHGFSKLWNKTLGSSSKENPLTKEFAKLSDYLATKGVKKDDDQAIMNAIKALLESGKGTDGEPVKESQERALKLLLKLEALAEGKKEMCNLKGYNILFPLVEAVATFAIEKRNLIENCIHNHAKYHANLCELTYRTSYQDKVDKVHSRHHDKVERMLRDFIQSQVDISIDEIDQGDESVIIKHHKKIELAHFVFNKFIDKEPTFGENDKDIAGIVDAIYELVDKDDYHGQYLKDVLGSERSLDKDRLASIIHKFLIEPCLYYHDALKPIIVPALFDAKFHSEMGSEVEYYLVVARFSTCNVVLHKGEQFWIQKVMKYLRKRV